MGEENCSHHPLYYLPPATTGVTLWMTQRIAQSWGPSPMGKNVPGLGWFCTVGECPLAHPANQLIGRMGAGDYSLRVNASLAPGGIQRQIHLTPAPCFLLV